MDKTLLVGIVIKRLAENTFEFINKNSFWCIDMTVSIF